MQGNLIFNLKWIIIGFILLIFNISYGANSNNRIVINPAIKKFGVKEGLPQVQITCLHVDKKGFLWVGTRNGLARWDGNKMHEFVNENQLKFYPQQVEALYELPDQSILALYTIRYGYVSYAIVKGNEIKYYRYYINTGFKKINPIKTKIAFVSSNLIRFNFLIDSNVYVYDFDRVKTTFTSKHFFKNVLQIHDAQKDLILFSRNIHDQNQILIEAFINKVRIFSKKISKKNFQTFESSKINSLSQMGVQYINFESNMLYRMSVDNRLNFKMDSTFLDFDIEENDRIRISSNGLICQKNKGETYFFKKGKSMVFGKMDLVWDFVKDKQGNLYVGTEHGLNCFFNQGIQELYLNENAKIDHIVFVSKMPDQGVFFSSTSKGLLYSKDKKTFSQYNIPGFNTNQVIGPVTYNKLNDVLFPLIKEDKIPVLSHGKWKFLDFKDKGNIFKIKTNPYSQDIYISSEKGIFKFDAKTKDFRKCIFQSPKLMNTFFYDFDFTSKGDLLLKNDIDAYQVSKNGQIKELSKDEVPGFSIYCDTYQSFWFNSGKSLFVYKNGKKYTMQNLPIKTPIMAISQIGKWLIVGSLHELTIMDLALWHQTGIEDYFTYSVSNQLNILEGSQNNFFIENDSVFYWPGLDKVLKFNLNKLVDLAHIPPKVSIQEYSFYNEKVKYNTYDSFEQQEYLIAPSLRDIDIKFTCPSYLNHNNIQYRYRQNSSSDWNYLKSNDMIRIIDIPSGTYQFEIQASFDGVSWSESEKSLPIVFQPRFYETFMFWSILLLLLAFFGYLVFRYFINKLKKSHEEELKKKIEKNILSLQVIKSKYIPHFTFNAMTSINYLLRKEEIKKASSYLVKMTELQRIALSNFDNPETTLETELKFLNHYLALEGLRFEDTFSYKIVVGKNVKLDVLVPNLSIHTMVENAIKHGLYHKPDGNWKLGVYIVQLKDKLIISVEDNGLGLEKANENKTHSTGSGLSMLKKQLKILSKNKKKYSYRLSDIYTANGQIRGARSSIFIISN